MEDLLWLHQVKFYHLNSSIKHNSMSVPKTFKSLQNLVLYIIWYGAWTTATQTPILNFVSTVGATPWWAINNPYGVGSLVYKKAVADNYSQGPSLNTSTVWSSVYNAITKGLLPLDTNAIYLVVSSR
jgi:hypothetical protein